MKQNFFDTAVIKLVGDCVFDTDGKTILDWKSPGKTQPSQSAIEAKMVELQEEWDSQEYARKRKAEYPDWGTQLNKIYDDGLAKWKSEMVDPIKAKYPKPE